MDKPGKEHWIDIIPEQEDVLSFVKIINEQFVVCYLHNAYYKLAIYDLKGQLQKEVPLPTYISITGVTGKKDSENDVHWLYFLPSSDNDCSL